MRCKGERKGEEAYVGNGRGTGEEYAPHAQKSTPPSHIIFIYYCSSPPLPAAKICRFFFTKSGLSQPQSAKKPLPSPKKNFPDRAIAPLTADPSPTYGRRVFSEVLLSASFPKTYLVS